MSKRSPQRKRSRDDIRLDSISADHWNEEFLMIEIVPGHKFIANADVYDALKWMLTDEEIIAECKIQTEDGAHTIFVLCKHCVEFSLLKIFPRLEQKKSRYLRKILYSKLKNYGHVTVELVPDQQNRNFLSEQIKIKKEGGYCFAKRLENKICQFACSEVFPTPRLPQTNIFKQSYSSMAPLVTSSFDVELQERLSGTKRSYGEMLAEVFTILSTH